jgi:hypothetical protein
LVVEGKGAYSGWGHVSSAAALLDVIVRNAPEKIVRISGEKIAAHYKIQSNNCRCCCALPAAEN